MAAGIGVGELKSRAEKLVGRLDWLGESRRVELRGSRRPAAALDRGGGAPMALDGGEMVVEQHRGSGKLIAGSDRVKGGRRGALTARPSLGGGHGGRRRSGVQERARFSSGMGRE